MDAFEFQARDKEAREKVEAARASLRDNPLITNFILEIRKDILIGMKFQVTNINYKDHQITFTLVE